MIFWSVVIILGLTNSSCSPKPNAVQMTTTTQIVPKKGIPGCEPGMRLEQINPVLRSELGRNLVFGVDGRLCMIAKVVNSKYTIHGYQVVIGTPIKDRSKLVPFGGSLKVKPTSSCLVNEEDGVIIEIDKQDTVVGFTVIFPVSW
jgi:hypothetical protein